ncbi:MAG: TRAP transporter small permease subunit [Henriciella sp.]|nr:TRAP transporter small permease subunit [Henriciella sp.]
MADLVPLLGAALRFSGYALAPLLLLPLLTLILPKLLHRPVKTLSAGLDRISGAAMAVAIGFAFAIIFIQLGAVLMRYVFGLSFSWLNDSVLFSFAAIFMLGAAATLRDDGHVRVDILRPRFSPSTRAIIELVGTYAFIFPIGALILYAGASGLARSWAGLEPFNESDGLPIKYIFKTLVPVFAVLMIGQGLAQALKAALSLRGLRPFDVVSQSHEGQV